MDHDGALLGAVTTDELCLEALRGLEVELDGRHLVRSTNGVTSLHGDLRTVEGAAAFVEHELQARPLGNGAQGLGGHVPVLVRSHRLERGSRREFQVEVRQAELSQEVQHEGQQSGELLPHLLLRAEDVGVVLGHATNAREAVDRTGELVAVHAAELEEPQWQLTVGALLGLVDERVERAVHGL